MSGSPNPDPQALMIVKAFVLCETFGWTLEDLDVPKEKQTQFTEGFLTIIRRRNEEQEKQNKLANLRNKFG